MNIFEMFRQPPPPAPAPAVTGTPQPAPGATGAPAAPAAIGADGNPLIPNSGNQPVVDANKSPLAEFSKLWETTVIKEGEQAPVDFSDPASVLPNLSVDPKKIAEAARKIDFSRVMNPEKVKAALAGDGAAFNEVINSVVQAAFANQAMTTSRIVDASLRQMAPKLLNEALPNLVKRHSVRETVVGNNPVFNDPAVAPMLSMLEQQMQRKNPQASAKEISDMAKSYLAGLAKVIGEANINDNSSGGNRRNAATGNKTGAAADDWDDFLFPSGTQQ